MTSRTTLTCKAKNDLIQRQRGAVLVFTLIALITIMLAAVALVRSVDTSTIIAGNIAFKQAATNSADSGVEAASTWLSTTYLANTSKNPVTDLLHPFNNDAPASGYYSSMAIGTDLMSDAVWAANRSIDVGIDATDNHIKYIIERMCRQPNQLVSETNCQFGGQALGGNDHVAGCDGYPGCLGRAQSRSPLYRITVRVQGPKNTTSFVQTFVQLS